jgi:hypothetical protein
MGRPTKFSDAAVEAILSKVRDGCPRSPAAESLGIDKTTLSKWLASKPTFSTLMAQAEAEAEARYAAVLQKAATGWNGGSVTRTTKTVFRTRKTKQPDGTIVEEPVPFEEVTETQVTERLFDWRAAESWLKRRRREDWGDGLALKLEKMSVGELVEFILGGPPVATGDVDSRGDREAAGVGRGGPASAGD